MYELKVDGLENLVKKFDAYNNQLDELHKQVPAELVEWQRVDMRRHYPNITVDDMPPVTSATTRVWPRSRMDQQLGHKRPTRPVVEKGPKQYGQVLRAPRGTAARWRPILRTELFRKLTERMERLGSEAIKWR
jgi:hypothetical protein